MNRVKLPKHLCLKKNSTQVDFDIENSVSHKLDNSIELIITKQKELDKSNYENKAITFIKNKEKIIPGSFVKVTNVSSNIKKIEYFDFNNYPTLTTIFNNNDQTITFVSFSNGKSFKKIKKFASNSSIALSNLMSIQTANAECGGDAVAACINDAYSNHGWITVWAWVQSAVIPETVLAIALSCAAKNAC